VPLSWRALGTRLTQCAWAEAYTSIPSDILIHPTVWHLTPTSHTDRTGQTRDNGQIAQGEPFYERSLENVFPVVIDGGLSFVFLKKTRNVGQYPT